MHRLRSHRRLLVLTIFALAGAAFGQSSYQAKPFTSTLTPESRVKMGYEKLTAEEVRVLNQQIERELTLARQGNVRGFAKTFTERRTNTDETAMGLSKLTPGERLELDRAIAWAMAVPAYTDLTARLPRSEVIEFVKPAKRVTGEVSVMVGAGSGGRSVYGGSISMTYKHPERDITTTVRYSEYHGDRWLLDDLYYGYPFSYQFSGVQRSLSIGVEIGNGK